MRPHWQDGISFNVRTPLDVLCQYSSLQCQNERDRVFALSGIMKAERTGIDDPDWDASIGYSSSAEQVYTAHAKWQLQAYQNDQRILLAATLFRNRLYRHSDLASWVPD